MTISNKSKYRNPRKQTNPRKEQYLREFNKLIFTKKIHLLKKMLIKDKEYIINLINRGIMNMKQIHQLKISSVTLALKALVLNKI